MKFHLKATGYVGSSIFDPRLRGERRSWDIEAESEEKVREIFQAAVDAKDPHVMGVSPFKIESIEAIG